MYFYYSYEYHRCSIYLFVYNNTPIYLEEEIKPFMAKDTDAERERGNAVKIQLSLWDNILQVII